MLIAMMAATYEAINDAQNEWLRQVLCFFIVYICDDQSQSGTLNYRKFFASVDGHRRSYNALLSFR